MIKHILAIILLSIVAVVSMLYAQQGLQWMVAAHDWVADALTQVFSGGQAGNIIRELIALLTVPVVIGLIPIVIYWVARRHFFPYFMQIVWIVWLLQFAALAIVYKVA
jgi:hypothetical protein